MTASLICRKAMQEIMHTIETKKKEARRIPKENAIVYKN